MKRARTFLFCLLTAALVHPLITTWELRAQVAGQPAQNGVVRLDLALDAIVREGARAELLKGEHFGAAEGPVWVAGVNIPGIRPLVDPAGSR
jgi:hypothetical protein